MKKQSKPKLPLLETIIEYLSKPNNSYHNYYSDDYLRYEGVDYDSDMYYACANGSDCCKDDYCRCGTITNARVISIDFDVLLNSFFKLKHEKSDSELIDSYCIDRILRNSSLKDLSSWKVNVTSGYYGQEVHGCTPDENVINELKELFQSLIGKSDVEKIKICLKNEYGYLLPELELVKDATICNGVDINTINLFNQNHYRKLNQKFVEQYNDYKFPRAICRFDGKYQVIDGYHRMMSANNLKLKKVSIIVLT